MKHFILSNYKVGGSRLASIIILLLFFSFATEAQKNTAAAPVAQSAVAEPVVLTTSQAQELQDEIMEYMEEVSQITAQISEADASQLKQLRRELQSIDARWQTFNAMEQNDIASTPALMELLSQYKQIYLATDDSITSQQARNDAQNIFNKAVAYITRCQLEYDDLLTKSQELSLLPQTAAQLDKVKAQEQLLMQQVSAQYTQAVTAANAVPSLKGQLATMEQKYIAIQEMSKKIQAAAYKPFIERIKDYLISFAAVAIIIMFITMAVSKISAMKKAREMAKKYGNMLNGSQEDIPTI